MPSYSILQLPVHILVPACGEIFLPIRDRLPVQGNIFPVRGLAKVEKHRLSRVSCVFYDSHQKEQTKLFSPSPDLWTLLRQEREALSRAHSSLLAPNFCTVSQTSSSVISRRSSRFNWPGVIS